MERYGKLSVRVLAGPGRVPLGGATVAVTQKTDGGKFSVLSVQATDAEGRIVPVAVSACADGGVALCDLWADHPDHKMLLEEDVSVPAGAESYRELIFAQNAAD